MVIKLILKVIVTFLQPEGIAICKKLHTFAT